MELLVKLPEKFTCWQVYIQLSMPCTSVFQATDLIHGYMTLWTTNLINSAYKIDIYLLFGLMWEMTWFQIASQ